MTAEAQSHKGLFIKVWFALLALTLVEVVLAYVQLEFVLMLTILMGLSLVKAPAPPKNSFKSPATSDMRPDTLIID